MSIRLRHMLRLSPSAKEINGLKPDDDVTFAPMEAIGDGLGGLDASGTKPLIEVQSGSYNYFSDGDVLLAKVTPCFENGKKALASGLTNGVGFATSEVHVLRPDPSKLDERFLFYLLSSEDFRAEGMKSMTGAGGLKRISDGAVLNYRPQITNLAQQKKIAAFLDRETVRIDGLISKKEQFVDSQYRRMLSKLQVLVLGGASVQRGLEGEWLHDLPYGWRLIPLKHLVSVMGGATPSKDRDDFWNGDIPWVSPKDMKYDIISDVPDHVSELALQNSAIQLVPKHAVLIVVRGMILARKVPICRLGLPATINQDMKALLPHVNIIRADYLQRMLQGFEDVLMSFIEEAAHGTKKLRSDSLFTLKFPVPPINIQATIVQEYEKEWEKSEKVIKATMASIDRLREYRAALITAAVAGEIDADACGKTGATSATLDRIEEEMQA